jgi:hypothetical protein
MSSFRGPALLVAALVAACGGKDGGGDPPPARTRPAQPQGIVIGAGNASTPGGHRATAGVVGGPTEARSAQYQVRGGIQP